MNFLWRSSFNINLDIQLFFFLFLATPQPDIFPSAKEVSPLGTVKLSWKDARQFKQPIEVEYTILYHKDGDRQNKVKAELAVFEQHCHAIIAVR